MLCAYDFRKDLDEKNLKNVKTTHSFSSSFDDSFNDNFNVVVEKLKDENERKKTNKNFFNKSSQR